MMSAAANSRDAERAEVNKTNWRIAYDLCGAVDGWGFRSYVLKMLFYRFICCKADGIAYSH